MRLSKWAAWAAPGILAGSSPAIAGFLLAVEARPFAERFLTQLDAGNVEEAHKMLSPSVRANYPARSLSRLGAVRGAKIASQRSFVRVRPTIPQLRINSVGKPGFPAIGSVVVCFAENPVANFRPVSYTAVTVSGRDPASLRIENFQTTSEPVTLCR